jgi:hypothetical protein
VTESTDSQPKSLWDKMSLSRLRWLFVLVLLAATAGFGGLKTADHVTPVAFGETFNDGVLLITPHSLKVASSVATMPNLPALTPECRYLVLDVTIKNAGDVAVPLPTAGVMIGKATDCQDLDSDPVSDPLYIAGINSGFAAAMRMRDNVTVPIAEPGFTEDFRMAWVVSQGELSSNRTISLRMPTMAHNYSTFRIARQWASDTNRYGEVTITSLEVS